MSETSLPEPVEIGAGDMQFVQGTAALTEFNFRYYGWRVALAACLGVMAGFGSLFVYTFSVFVKPLAAQFGWSREAISSGFAIAAVTLGSNLSAAGPVDRPLRSSPNHSSMHDGVWMRHCLTILVAFHGVAVLSDLLCSGFGGKRCRSSGVFEIHLHMVSATPGRCSRSCHGRSGFGGHDSTRHRPIDNQPVGLAHSVRLAWRSCVDTRIAAQLALHTGARSDGTQVCFCCAFWKDLAAGSWLFSFLDYYRDPFREFDQHERGNHSPVSLADRSRSYRPRCGALRIHTRWNQSDWQSRRWMAAGPVLRAACRARHKPAHRAWGISAGSGRKFLRRLPCYRAHWHRGWR